MKYAGASREREEWRHIKIVMLSAKGRDADVVKGMQLIGADLYITKPFSTRELMAQVRGLLERGAQSALDRTAAAAHPKVPVSSVVSLACDSSPPKLVRKGAMPATRRLSNAAFASLSLPVHVRSQGGWKWRKPQQEDSWKRSRSRA